MADFAQFSMCKIENKINFHHSCGIRMIMEVINIRSDEDYSLLTLLCHHQ